MGAEQLLPKMVDQDGNTADGLTIADLSIILDVFLHGSPSEPKASADESVEPS
ncbi:hypothetical protein [Streptomyces sp. NPDC050704]|uniref:hypothetical protein n=1 Tax=Streptomyces sp. NPDC050704 TaxID=3157219 RepID=UPI00341FB43F